MEGRRTGTKVEEGRTIGPEGGEWIEGRLVKAAFQFYLQQMGDPDKTTPS